jgi:sterol desaturase/sphingolipid hydroxylase (fatty acid hydroxylase superfamily)
MVDPWSFLLLAVYLGAAGPSPLAIPFAVWVVFADHAVKWQLVRELFPDLTLPMVFIPLISIIVYWVNGLLLFCIDVVFRPDVLVQYKIQKSQQFDMKKIRAVLQNLIFNQIFVIFPFSVAVTLIMLQVGGRDLIENDLPSHKEMALHTIGFVLCDEVLFYYGHRMLHHKSIYKYCHKIHHEFTSPIGLVASYAHPFEMVVSNLIPLFAGCIPLNSHAYTVLGWVVFAVLGTQTHHCGYHWPWMFYDHQPSFHDFHHQKFSCNFGNITWLDKLHGTDKQWVEHQKAEKAAKVAAKAAKSN